VAVTGPKHGVEKLGLNGSHEGDGVEIGLRVALFSGNYNYQADGANKALNRLVAFLESQDIEVLVFSPTSDTPDFEPAGTLISVPSIPVPGRGEYRIGFGLSDKLKRRLKRFNPTLIHLSAPDVLGHSALKFAENNNIPVVASFHTRFDTYFKYYKLGWLESYSRKKMAQFYDRCAHVYAPSHSVGVTLQEQNIVNGNLRIWSRGIDRTRFHPKHRDMAWRRSLGITDTDIALGFVGRLVREKGLAQYVDLVTTLTDQGLPVKALIVGDGPEHKTIKRLLPEAVMTGHITDRDLWRAYASCDVFINPSETETFGNVTLEAMASGLPTVCLKATGSNDLVQHGTTGWLINSAEDPQWVEKTAMLCLDKELRNRMGQAARQASADYNWNRIMHDLLHQYREVAQSVQQPALNLTG